MKKISLNEMECINGGLKLQTMCFGLGLLTVFSLAQPLTIYYASPGIKYCWNN